MTKIAGLTYVDEFTFPTEQGFTGSAGKHNVRGYYRGGRVKDPVKAAAQKKRAPGPGAAHGGYLGDSKKGMPKGVKARGGKMEYAEGGEVGVTTPRRGKSMPQQARQTRAAKKSAKKAHGGEMSTHDKLRKEGEAMGYAYGGQVKNTSSEFVQKSMGQDSMDHANYPPGHPASARDKESGPRKKLRPRFKGGGNVHQVRDMPAKRRAKSGKGMPKGVKARGGLAEYAGGGYGKGGKKSGKPGYKEGGTARLDPSIVPGTGAAELGARALLEHERQTSNVADAARADAMRAMQTTPVEQDVPPEPAAVATPKPKRKPAPGSERGKRQHYGLQFKKSVINPDVVGAAVGGPVTAAKGGRKKSRKMR